MIGLRNGQVKSFGNTVYGDAHWGCGSVNPNFINDWKSDPRFVPSVIDCAGEGVTMLPNHTAREYTGYYLKKYASLNDGTQNIYTAQSLDFQFNHYFDYVIVRYADVLLMLSELTGDAQYMNAVRTRVGLTDVAYSTDALREERKRELAFEGIRYWDLLRYGVDYAANAVNCTVTVQNGGGTDPASKTIDGNMLKACKGLSQIPNNQITLSSGVLKQNEGWK
jgi:hypothetical protein